MKTSSWVIPRYRHRHQTYIIRGCRNQPSKPEQPLLSPMSSLCLYTSARHRPMLSMARSFKTLDSRLISDRRVYSVKNISSAFSTRLQKPLHHHHRQLFQYRLVSTSTTMAAQTNNNQFKLENLFNVKGKGKLH